MRGLAIPDHEKWFNETFGKEGAQLDAQYTALLNDPKEDFRKIFEYSLKSNRAEPEVRALEPGQKGVKGLEGAILEDMVRTVPVYIGNAKHENDEYPVQLGYFFFVDGEFRLVDSRVFQQLSNAPVMRVKMGGNVRAKSLVNRVQPAYPDEARAKGISGTVRLHVVTAIDGSVKDLTIVSGDRILAQAAVEAVRQWKYQPILLNGKPVEVDSTVDVIFSLN